MYSYADSSTEEEEYSTRPEMSAMDIYRQSVFYNPRTVFTSITAVIVRINIMEIYRFLPLSAFHESLNTINPTTTKEHVIRLKYCYGVNIVSRKLQSSSGNMLHDTLFTFIVIIQVFGVYENGNVKRVSYC